MLFNRSFVRLMFNFNMFSSYVVYVWSQIHTYVENPHPHTRACLHIRIRCAKVTKLLLLWMICFSASNYSKSLFIKAKYKDFKFLRPPQSHRINWIVCQVNRFSISYFFLLSLPLFFSFLCLFSEFSSKRLRTYSDLGGFFLLFFFNSYL